MNTDDFCSYCGTELDWDDDSDFVDGKMVGGSFSFCPNISKIEDDITIDDQTAMAEMKKHDGGQ